MQIEHISVSPGLYWTQELPLLQDGDPATNLTDFEFQLQVRSLDGTLLGLGTVEVSGSNLLLTITPTLISAMDSGTKQLWRTIGRQISTGAVAALKGGGVRLMGVPFPWQ